VSVLCPLCRHAARTVCRLATSEHDVARCGHCRVAFLHPEPSPEQLSAVYAAYYRHDNSDLNPLTAARYDEILGRIERARGPGRLLDVGCGAGQFLEVARRRGWQTSGTEISESARQYLGARGLTVHQGSLPDLALENSFELVSLIEVLEHLPDPLAHLAAAARALRPAGWLYLTTPNFDGLSRRLIQGRWRVLAPEHLFYYSPRALRRALEPHFDAIEIRTKNLDVADLRAKLRPRRSPETSYSNIAETTVLRERIEASRSLRLAKAVTNTVLRLSGTGDTLEVYARRRTAA
jgi:SAM-dependent methyltransferase